MGSGLGVTVSIAAEGVTDAVNIAEHRLLTALRAVSNAGSSTSRLGREECCRT